MVKNTIKIRKELIKNIIKSKRKILTIAPRIYPGVSAVFLNGEKLKLWDFKYLEEITKQDLENYQLYIFGAYHQLYEFPINFCSGKKAILWTSSIGQMEGSNEMPVFNRVLELFKTKKIQSILIGSKDLYKSISRDGINYFPYPLNFYKHSSETKFKSKIGLFAPTHHRKNHLNQIHGFRMACLTKPKLELLTNSGIKTYGNIKYYNWIPQNSYNEILSHCYMILNVFHTESFAYSTAEAIMNGTLPIISQCIRDNFELPNKLVVKNPDSAVQISEKILEMLDLPENKYFQLIKECQKKVDKLSKIHNPLLKKLIAKYIN